MSRKKCTIDDLFSTRLKSLIEDTLKISQVCFANKVGISQSYLSAILKKKRGLSAELIIGLYLHYREYLDWLLAGEGKMIRKPEKNGFKVAEGVAVYNKVGMIEDDPETVELLTMTWEIIKSNTGYAHSLAANIRSFHHAMKTEKRMSDFESELSLIKEIVKKRPTAQEGSGVKKKM